MIKKDEQILIEANVQDEKSIIKGFVFKVK